MTENIHTCSYTCNRPACIKQQRDELWNKELKRLQEKDRQKFNDCIIDKEFEKWWDADELTQTNPFREDSPAYWAWEGWQARALLSRKQGRKE